MKKNVPPLLWFSVSVAIMFTIGFLDYITDYKMAFFVFYIIPISVSAWFAGLRAAIIIAVFSAIVWFVAGILSGVTYSAVFFAVWNTSVRLTSFLIIGWAFSSIRSLFDREHQLAEELRKSILEVKVLKSFLPICCQCKKIRNDEGKWQNVELYIHENTGTHFSHSYCPACAKKAMEDAGLIS